MAEKVMIEVVGKAMGLDEANQQLKELEDAQNKRMEKREEILKKIAKLEQDGRVAAFNAKNADEQSAAVQKYGKAVEAERKSLSGLKTEIEKNKKSIEDLSAAQKKMLKEMNTENVTKSFRTLKRELTEQLNAWSDWSTEGQKAFRKVLEQAGELDDKMRDTQAMIRFMGSDTAAFDAILDGTQLAAGGFSALTGTMSLFGVENEDLQKSMVKLQSLIAITTGLQQVQNALQKESNLMTGISVIQTKAKAAAESAAAKGTVAATIAQKFFNVVASANPYLLLFTGLAAVATALFFFTRNTESAAEAQKKLNEQEQLSLDIRERNNQRLKEDSDRRLKALNDELELAKIRGEGIAKIRALEDEIAQARKTDHEERKKQNTVDLENLEENRKKLKELEKQLDKVNEKKLKGDKKVWVDVDLDGKLEKTKIDEAVEALQGQIDNTNKRIKIAVDLKTEEDDSDNEANKRKAQREKEDAERAKRSAQALADYRVLMAVKGSEKELQAQKAALQVKLKNELSNIDLSEGERVLKRAETQKAIEKLDEDYRNKQLQDAVTTIDAELAIEKEFNIETLNLRQTRLEAQKTLDLANAKDDTAKQLLIEEQHKANLIKLWDDYAKSEAQRTANINQSDINARLAGVKKGSDEEHDLRVESLEKTAEAEIENANLSIKNEEEKAAKIKEIQAKLNRDKSDLDIEYIRSADERSKSEVLIATQQYEKGIISRRKYEKQLLAITIQALKDEIAERKLKGDETVKLEKELSEKIKAVALDAAEYKKRIFQETFNLMGDIGNMFFDMQSQKLTQEMEDLNHYYTTSAEAANKNKDLQLITENELARRQLEIRRKQAQAEKNQAYFNATLKLAEGVVRIWSEKGVDPVMAAILTGILVASTAVQIASIQNKPLPKYWKGRKGGKGEWAMAGEYGPELMWLPAGASIMPNGDTRRALRGDVNLFDKWDMPRINPNIPVAPFVSQKIINQYNQEHRGEDRIDYDKLGRAVAKHMKFPKQKDVSIHFDKSGLSVAEGNTTTHYLNEKYNR